MSYAESAVSLGSSERVVMTEMIKTEAGDEISGHCTAIKRHTIDAILGLPRLAGYHHDLGLDNDKLNRSSFSESEDKLDVDGECFTNEAKGRRFFVKILKF